jgi:hypothetical protein
MAAALAIVAAAALVGCSSTPSLSDPREILRLAAGQLRDARTVHLDATIDGTVQLGALLGAIGGLPGGGGGLGGAFGGPLALTGTHLAGDVDRGRTRATVAFEVPAMLGLRGELRQVGSDAWLSSTLTSAGWHAISGAAVPLGAGAPLGWLDTIEAWLADPATVPIRLDDASCNSGTCYEVQVVITTDQLKALASPGPGVPGTGATLVLSVDRGTLRISSLTASIDLGEGGALDVSIQCTHWNDGVTIEPPPSAEIVAGPLLP